MNDKRDFDNKHRYLMFDLRVLEPELAEMNNRRAATYVRSHLDDAGHVEVVLEALGLEE